MIFIELELMGSGGAVVLINPYEVAAITQLSGRGGPPAEGVDPSPVPMIGKSEVVLNSGMRIPVEVGVNALRTMVEDATAPDPDAPSSGLPDEE